MHPALGHYYYYSSSSEALPPDYEMAQFSETAGGYAHTSARQTALEFAAATPFSLSGWLIVSNNGLYFHRIVGVGQIGSSNLQYSLGLNPITSTSTQHSKLRFVMFTTSANWISIDSGTHIDRNRPVHFTITWNGVAAAGLDIYIDGVKESSPTRTTTGTFGAAYSNASLRFIIGRDGANDTFRGNLRDLARWGKKLSDAEVTELYNDGEAIDVDTVSFYGDCTSYWPMRTDAVSLQNANYNLATTSGLTFVERQLDVDSKNISFKKVEIANARYVAFGSLVKISNTLAYWIGRSGTTHLANGKITKTAIHLDTGVVDAPVDIITDGSFDIRSGQAGIINGKIFIFSARYNTAGATFQDLRYWESTDGLTGETYAASTALTTTLSTFNAFGEIVEGFSDGEYFVPFHESDGVSAHKIFLYKTTDHGAVFSRVDVYSNTTYLAEGSLINLGSNRLMFICRRQSSPYKLYRILSTDGGATWEVPIVTNLGSTGLQSMAGMCLTADGKLNVIFADRGDEYLWISRDNVIADIVASPTAFNTPLRLANTYAADSLGILGYPQQVRITGDEFCTTYSAESAAGVADLYVGFGKMENA